MIPPIAVTKSAHVRSFLPAAIASAGGHAGIFAYQGALEALKEHNSVFQTEVSPFDGMRSAPPAQARCR